MTVRFAFGRLNVTLEASPDDQADLLEHLVNHGGNDEPTTGAVHLRLTRTPTRGREVFEDDDAWAAWSCCDEVSLGHILHRMTVRQHALYDEWTCLHAGAVSIGGRLVIVAGSRGAGKTTLLLQLLKNGAEFHCDEYVLARGGIARTLPRRLHVKPGTLDCLPELRALCESKPLLSHAGGPRFYAIDPVELGYQWSSKAARPAMIVYLEPDFEREPELVPLSQIATVQRLMCEAISGHAHVGTQAERICSVVNGVPCSVLRVGALSRTADLLADTVAALFPNV